MDLKKNQAVKFIIRPLNATSDGFATYTTCGGMIKLFEKIDLGSYPSCSDFKGKSYHFNGDEVGIVIKFVGRPDKVNRDPQWFKYDIYEVLISGKVVQVFRENLEPIP